MNNKVEDEPVYRIWNKENKMWFIGRKSRRSVWTSKVRAKTIIEQQYNGHIRFELIIYKKDKSQKG